MKTDLIKLYSDYLLSSYGRTTATGLSEILDGAFSHDQTTRLLSGNEFTSKTLWNFVRPVVRQVEKPDGVPVLDDTIQEKPSSRENGLVSWHSDHTESRNVKGINLLNCVCHTGETTIPAACHLVEKTIWYSGLKTRKERYKSEFTKNCHFRKLIGVCCQNNLLFRYVLTDSWFCSSGNMKFIRHDCGRNFIMATKSNRRVSPSEEDRKQGRSQRIDTVNIPEDKPVKGWITGVDFPVLLFRQVFKNRDDSTGILYPVCSDLNCDAEALGTVHKKRWKVEEFHKTLKSDAAMAESPAHTVRTQSSHLFLSICSVFRLETFSPGLKMNHFQTRAKLYMTAIRSAFKQLQLLGECVT
jgi:hypothetical protein